LFVYACAHSDAYSDTNSHSHPDAHADTHPDTNTDAYAYADTKFTAGDAARQYFGALP
jgi:hypothetical protein